MSRKSGLFCSFSMILQKTSFLSSSFIILWWNIPGLRSWHHLIELKRLSAISRDCRQNAVTYTHTHFIVEDAEPAIEGQLGKIGTKDRTPFGSSQIYTHSSARKIWIFVQCERFTRPTCTATISFLLFSFCITDTSMDTDLRNPWNVRPDFWSVTAVFWVFFLLLLLFLRLFFTFLFVKRRAI